MCFVCHFYYFITFLQLSSFSLKIITFNKIGKLDFILQVLRIASLVKQSYIYIFFAKTNIFVYRVHYDVMIQSLFFFFIPR